LPRQPDSLKMASPYPYATADDYRTFYGSERTADQHPGVLADETTILDDALGAAAARIDAAAAAGGFAAPIDASALGVTADIQGTIEQRLRVCCAVLASAHFIGATDDTQRSKDARQVCERFLEELAQGGGLPVAPADSGGDFDFFEASGTTDFHGGQIDGLRSARGCAS